MPVCLKESTAQKTQVLQCLGEDNKLLLPDDTGERGYGS